VYRCVQKDKSTLNPIKFIKFVEEAISREPSMLDEVALRRFISALYFSLFNYWAERSYIKGRRGKGGPCQDSFSYSEFHTYLSQRQLDFVAHLLFLYRVAADHYTLNPTYVRLQDRLWGGVYYVELNYDSLKRAIELAKKALRAIEGQ
jgi:hypothetical protein